MWNVSTLILAVPHREIVHNSGKQARLGDAEEEASHKKAVHVLHDAEKRGHDAPGKGQDRQPDAGRCLLQDDVARDLASSGQCVRTRGEGAESLSPGSCRTAYLEEDIADEVQCQAGEVLVPS